MLALESGVATCGLFAAQPDTAKTRKAFGVGAGCCFLARVRDATGGWHRFATLPDEIKKKLATRMEQ